MTGSTDLANVAGLAAELDRVAAATGFSGVVRVDLDGEVLLQRAYGLAHRAEGVASTVATRFGLASGTKGLTALVVGSLIEDGVLALATTARSVLGDDLPLVPSDVTVQHLLEHRSGIGDYVDEDAGWTPTDHVLPVPVHVLETTEDYLKVLDGFPAVFPPGTQFRYCNGGYVVLALVAERVGGERFADLVQHRVCQPAGMTGTAFLRSDELPGGVARGYLPNGRTNVFHLPVRGSGDGGVYSTVADIRALWSALHAGRIVTPATVAELTRPRSQSPEGLRYGRGFWLHPSCEIAFLEGLDAGVSFRSVHDPVRDLTHTVVSNTDDGAWPVTKAVDELVSREPLP